MCWGYVDYTVISKIVVIVLNLLSTCCCSMRQSMIYRIGYCPTLELCKLFKDYRCEPRMYSVASEENWGVQPYEVRLETMSWDTNERDRVDN